jgi:membrane-associated protease RseP (regulator of RpoE activity)
LILDLDAQPQYRIGVETSAPDETLRKQLRLGAEGVVVTGVIGGKPAEKQGVRSGDVIVSANGKPVKDPHDLSDEVRRAAESPVELELIRGGVRLKIGVTPEKEPVTTVNFLTGSLTFGRRDRELMLVHPHGTILTDGEVTARPATRPAGPAAERLDQITKQLDALRAAVEALRADVARHEAPVKQQP